MIFRRWDFIKNHWHKKSQFINNQRSGVEINHTALGSEHLISTHKNVNSSLFIPSHVKPVKTHHGLHVDTVY